MKYIYNFIIGHVLSLKFSSVWLILLLAMDLYVILVRYLFLDVGHVWFTLNGTMYQNNSLVSLKDIGEGDEALNCMTDQPACCRPPYTNGSGQQVLGNWFFPNGSRVPNSGEQSNFHRTRSQSVVRLHRRRGGEDGIYSCVVPDATNVTQTLYIGVYTASTGESMTMKMLVHAL